jgi:hypothetical protein
MRLKFSLVSSVSRILTVPASSLKKCALSAIFILERCPLKDRILSSPGKIMMDRASFREIARRHASPATPPERYRNSKNTSYGLPFTGASSSGHSSTTEEFDRIVCVSIDGCNFSNSLN